MRAYIFKSCGYGFHDNCLVTGDDIRCSCECHVVSTEPASDLTQPALPKAELMQDELTRLRAEIDRLEDRVLEVCGLFNELATIYGRDGHMRHLPIPSRDVEAAATLYREVKERREKGKG